MDEALLPLRTHASSLLARYEADELRIGGHVYTDSLFTRNGRCARGNSAPEYSN